MFEANAMEKDEYDKVKQRLENKKENLKNQNKVNQVKTVKNQQL